MRLVRLIVSAGTCTKNTMATEILLRIDVFSEKTLTLYEPMCIGTLTLNLSGVSQIGDPWFAGFCRKGVFECGN